MPHPADSLVQRNLEAVVLARACADRSLPSAIARRIALGNAHVHVDGWIDGTPPVAIEVYVKLGRPKAAQGSKLCKDVLKLGLLAREVRPQPRCVLLVTCSEVERWLNASWIAEARRAFGVEIWRVMLTDEEKIDLQAATIGQAAGNRVRGVAE